MLPVCEGKPRPAVHVLRQQKSPVPGQAAALLPGWCGPQPHGHVHGNAVSKPPTWADSPLPSAAARALRPRWWMAVKA